jgi:hypothetical protein
MGLFEFLIIAVVVIFACWLAVFALGYIAPGHPPVIDRIIYGVGILIILVMLLQATGILAHDIQIPRLR